jgi:hypothetical protein
VADVRTKLDTIRSEAHLSVAAGYSAAVKNAGANVFVAGMRSSSIEGDRGGSALRKQ